MIYYIKTKPPSHRTEKVMETAVLDKGNKGGEVGLTGENLCLHQDLTGSQNPSGKLLTSEMTLRGEVVTMCLMTLQKHWTEPARPLLTSLPAALSSLPWGNCKPIEASSPLSCFCLGVGSMQWKSNSDTHLPKSSSLVTMALWLLNSNLWSLEWQRVANNHKNLGFGAWILTETMGGNPGVARQGPDQVNFTIEFYPCVLFSFNCNLMQPKTTPGNVSTEHLPFSCAVTARDGTDC